MMTRTVVLGTFPIKPSDHSPGIVVSSAMSGEV